MDRNCIAPALALLVCFLVAPGCGSEFTVGQGSVTVDGLSAGSIVLCGSDDELLHVTGSGFLSEHGNQIIVRFTALEGTPFNGQASQEVMGTALSDGLVECHLPSVSGATELTLTIILPGSNLGTSPPQTVQLGGMLVGPFAINDDFTDVTGNVTYDATAPGVLLNDIPSMCGESEGEPGKPRPAPGTPAHAVLLGNLAVVAPPPGFPDDASPGVTTPTDQGGTVVIQADGSFVYEPPLGYEGADFFHYWMTEPDRPTDRARADLNVSKVVWFIRDTAVSQDAFFGTGRFSDPFDSLLSFNNAQNVPATEPFAFPPTAPISPNPDDAPQEGDCIFVYDNVVTNQYDGGIRLRDGQQLIGESVGLFVNNTQIVPAAGPGGSPVLTNSGMSFGEQVGGYPVVTLGSENVVVGIDIEEPEFGGSYGDGILGFEVSGPTLIDQVEIRDAGFNGIHLYGFSETPALREGQALLGGTYQIGDPGGQGLERVTIRECGEHGILINGGFGEPANVQAVVGGLAVNVVGTTIAGTDGNGIEASDVNLDVGSCVIDDCEIGINYANFQFQQLCTLGVADTDIGLDAGTGPARFQGIRIIPFDSRIQATITGVSGRAQDTFLYGGGFFTGSELQIAFDGNEFETFVTSSEVPTVDLFGLGTFVTSMQSNHIVGNGTGEGMWFSQVTFDSTGFVPAFATVSGGDTDLGQGVATNQRVEGTALRFFNCDGDLAFDSLDIFQLGGDPSGIENTGTLTIDSGVFSIDHQP
jgi:hypothetical protein